MFRLGPLELIILIPIILIVLGVLPAIVVLVVVAARGSNKAKNLQVPPVAPASAKEIAQQRYARGEISREQYQQMLEDLDR